MPKITFKTDSGFYTKLNVWGSLGLNLDYDGGPIIENMSRILEVSTSLREGIGIGVSCQTSSLSYLNHLYRPHQIGRNFRSFFGAGF